MQICKGMGEGYTYICMDKLNYNYLKLIINKEFLKQYIHHESLAEISKT
jgi:hypothetical protein